MTHHVYDVKEFVILKKKESLRSFFLSISTIKLRVTRIIHLVILNTKLKTMETENEVWTLLISHCYHTCGAHIANENEEYRRNLFKKKKKTREREAGPDHVITRTEFQRAETLMETRVSLSVPFLSSSSSSSSFPSFLFKIEFITGDDSMTSYRGWPDRETKKPPSCSPIRLMDFGKPDGYCSLRTLNPFSTIDGSSR